MLALRLMFPGVSLKPELRRFLAPTGIGVGGNSQIREIVNRQIRQLASQRRQAGCLSNPVCACDEEEHVLYAKEAETVASWGSQNIVTKFTKRAQERPLHPGGTGAPHAFSPGDSEPGRIRVGSIRFVYSFTARAEGSSKRLIDPTGLQTLIQS